MYSHLEKELKVEDIKDRCIQYSISRTQRISELNMDLGLEGTKGYDIIGCYDCDGRNTECDKYMDWDLKNGR